MKSTQRPLIVASVLLPLVAGLVFVSAAPASASHFTVCWYGGEQYSEGACLYTACIDPDEAQKCTAIGGGTWSNCLWCDEGLQRAEIDR